MKLQLRHLLIIVTASLFWPSTGSSQEAFKASGMLDFNAYPYLSDVDNDSVFTLNIASSLPGRFSYFSLLNLIDDADSGLSDTVSYYTEQNIRWKISPSSPFDLTLQMNFRTGTDNDRHRLGVRWRLNDTPVLNDWLKAINLTWAVNLHAIQFDQQPGRIFQLEHGFRMTFPYLTDRAYLAGFIDHTFNEELPESFPDNPIVSEVQFGYRVVENLFVVAEYRLNQYRRSDVNNLAVGLQYKLNW